MISFLFSPTPIPSNSPLTKPHFTLYLQHFLGGEDKKQNVPTYKKEL